ncbi:hypothetical protein L1987_75978 [Smallanthus sonchifolius]|uniref:Uncharacterized protein n=1 Tax=Smallanthus sonchifolius TaxID=185202 RepID=A0ACB9A6H9_9ASTR|nr:hypothetical protein L1987_75978 [Smallanthus sonchifolius]
MVICTGGAILMVAQWCFVCAGILGFRIQDLILLRRSPVQFCIITLFLNPRVFADHSEKKFYLVSCCENISS